MPPVYMNVQHSKCQWKVPILQLQNVLDPGPVLGDIFAVVQFVAGT